MSNAIACVCIAYCWLTANVRTNRNGDKVDSNDSLIIKECCWLLCYLWRNWEAEKVLTACEDSIQSGDGHANTFIRRVAFRPSGNSLHTAISPTLEEFYRGCTHTSGGRYHAKDKQTVENLVWGQVFLKENSEDSIDEDPVKLRIGLLQRPDTPQKESLTQPSGLPGKL